jgi:hypothetical protein
MGLERTMNSNIFSPRLPTSKTWTELPGDFAAKLQEVFSRQFAGKVPQGEFIVDGRIYPDEVVMLAGHLEAGRLRQINFEASVDLPLIQDMDPNGEEDEDGSITMSRLYVCIDALGSLMEEYFEKNDVEEMDVPLAWRPYEFENETVHLKYSTVNTRLEEEADRILGLLSEALVNENEQSEDALANAEIDSELAEQVQQMIREGKHPLQN